MVRPWPAASFSCRLQCWFYIVVFISYLVVLSSCTPQPFYGPFPGPPGWAGARRELLDFMVQGKINRGRHTDHPAGRHSIRANQCLPPPSSPYFLHAGCPCCHPTNSVKALNLNQSTEGMYIGWNDVTVICGHITISVLWGNTAYCVKLSGEDLSRYSNKIESAGLRKCPYYHCLTEKVMSE